MEKILRGVRHFHDHVFPEQRELFETLARQQKPRALFITCSDSRVHPNLITQTDPGDLFILRNPGNIVPPYHAGNDSEAATIEYAAEVLKVEDIIICGHSNCGAMQALFNRESLSNLPSVASWLHHAEATRRIILSEDKERSAEERWHAAVAQNVLVQMEHLRTHPAVLSQLVKGQIRLHAWVYDIGSGDVSEFDADQGRFISLTSPDSHGPEMSLRKPRMVKT